MARHYWTDAATRDLNDVYDYLADRDPGAAERLIDEFDRKADLYAGNPLLGEAHFDLVAELRAFRVRSYVVFYRPYRDGIAIARIVHSARDLPRLFSAEP